MTENSQSAPCPCGSGIALSACCGPWISGADAPTAAQLMRARYSAYALGDGDFVRGTWHASTCPTRIDLSNGPHWIGLDVRKITAGEAEDEQGTVEFIARYRDGARVGTLHETSRFVREQGKWYYVDGVIHADAAAKAGRNGPCPCGSGKKHKRCCAT